MNARIDIDEFARFCERSRAAMDTMRAGFDAMRAELEAALGRLEGAISDIAEPKPRRAKSEVTPWNWSGLETLRDLPRNLRPRQYRVESSGRLSRGLILGPCVASSVLAILIEREHVDPGSWTPALDVARRSREEGFQQSKTFKDFLYSVAGRGRVLASVGLVERTGHGAGCSLRIAPGAIDTIKAFGPDVGLFISNAAVGRAPEFVESFHKTLEDRKAIRGGTT